MPNQPKVVIWGLGVMGRGIASMIASGKEMRIVGAIARRDGGDLGDLLGLPSMGIKVTGDPDVAFADNPDVCMICTASRVQEVYPMIEATLTRGTHVISIAEEMAYPWAHAPELAQKIHDLALRAQRTVLGTGINPGFVLDSLVIALTGACRTVRHIHGKRVNDLSPFGPTVMRTQGVGVTVEEFHRGLKTGAIVGHVGFRESVMLIAKALGWHIDSVKETREPLVSKVRRQSLHALVEPGKVAGCRHVARAFSGGEEVILLEHPQQILPELEGVETGDYIHIDGDPPINLSIKPEIPGGIGTIAVATNMIPLVCRAQPGLTTMADLPLPRASGRRHP